MDELYTTIASIKKLKLCKKPLDWFLAGCNGKFRDNERIPLLVALKIFSRKGYEEKYINPVRDSLYLYGKAIFPKRKARKVILTFLADLAEDVLSIFEGKYPNDNRPRIAIDTLRAYLRGEKTLKQVKGAAYAAARAAEEAATRTHRAAEEPAARAAKEAAALRAYATYAAYAAYVAYAAADAASDVAAHATYAVDAAARTTYTAYAVAGRKHLRMLKKALK